MVKFLVTIMGLQIDPWFLQLYIKIGANDKTKEI